MPDNDPKEGPVDPLAALEKTTEAQNHMNNVQKPRIEALQSLADHYGSDPYSLSLKVRKRFRVEKKIEKEKQEADKELKGKYGLPEELSLVSAEDEDIRTQAKEEWLKGKQMLESRQNAKKRKLVEIDLVPSGPSSRSAPKVTSTSSDPVASLRARILGNTARRKPANNKIGIVRR